MTPTYWQQQTASKPLFPDIEWSKPEQRALAGRLGIIGGNKLGFAAVAEAYSTAHDSGVGEVRVLLPDALLISPQCEWCPVRGTRASEPPGGEALPHDQEASRTRLDPVPRRDGGAQARARDVPPSPPDPAMSSIGRRGSDPPRRKSADPSVP